MPSPTLDHLGPAATTSARDLVAGLDLAAGAPGGGPRVVAVMIASLDGRAAVGGSSAPLGHPADTALLRELRAHADALLVGSRTIAAEGYADLLDDDQVAARRERGQAPHPVLATVSRRLDLDLAPPVFHEAGTPVAVYTEAEGRLDGLATHRLAPLTLDGVVAHLGEHHGARSVVCEGGPGLLRELVAAGALHDLLLTVSPLLVGGEPLPVLAGDALDPPRELRLRAVHQADSHLVLHLVAA